MKSSISVNEIKPLVTKVSQGMIEFIKTALVAGDSSTTSGLA